jgi:hypothetical protein
MREENRGLTPVLEAAAIESETYTGGMRLQGEVRMDGNESSESLQIDAELSGMRALERVPTLTADGF